MTEAVDRSATSTASHQDLVASLDPLLRQWLPRQRWFGGKGLAVSGVSVVAATELMPLRAAAGLLHLLVRVRQPQAGTGAGAGAETAAGTADCYQLLLGVCQRLSPRIAPAARIGRPETGALAGREIYDGLRDPWLARLLLERLRTPGHLDALHFDHTASTAPPPNILSLPSGRAPRLLRAEQSNSSLVYGDTWILKLFRRVHSGTHPELELPLALARQGCVRVPAPVAWFAHQGTEPADEPSLLGVLQPLLPAAENGWTRALRTLTEGRDFTSEARALGRATAEVHRALAKALPTHPLDRGQAQLIVGGMTRRLAEAVHSVPALRPYAPGLAAALAAVTDVAEDGAGRTAQRIHGDLHLGQCLRSPDGTWHLIDFEGEPARPLPERRRPKPAVRDIAGMLRSFDYAAHIHNAPQWSARSRDAYCCGYADITGSDPRDEAALLHAYETDKAIYEVLYEARHRPDWVDIPMAAIRRLAGRWV